MIDIENDVIQLVADTVLPEYPDAEISGEYTEYPVKFPTVTVEEIDNRIFERMRADKIENAATVTYQVNVFSNKAGERKQEAKNILALIDEALAGHGFTRIMTEHIPNLNNSKIFRLVARYEAVVGPGLSANTYLIYQS